MSARKLRPQPKKTTRRKRGPKTDAEKVELVRWYFETEKLRHP